VSPSETEGIAHHRVPAPLAADQAVCPYDGLPVNAVRQRPSLEGEAEYWAGIRDAHARIRTLARCRTCYGPLREGACPKKCRQYAAQFGRQPRDVPAVLLRCVGCGQGTMRTAVIGYIHLGRDSFEFERMAWCTDCEGKRNAQQRPEVVVPSGTE